MDLQATIELIKGYIYGAWRYRWLAVIVASAICLLAWPIVYTMPSKYEASTKIYVDTDTLLRPLLRGLFVETDLMNDISMITRTLMSRTQLEKVVRETDLDLTAKTSTDMEQLVVSVEERISLKNQGTNTYTISFTDSDREIALSIVRKLLDNFVSDTLGNTLDDSKQAEATLEAQIADYERRLEQAENRLKTFKQENVGLMPDSRGDYYAQQSEAEAAAESVRKKMVIAQHRLRALEAQLEGEEPLFGLMPGNSPTQSQPSRYDAQIATLEERLANLLIEFTEVHPEVVRTEKLVNELRAKRTQELAAMPQSVAPRLNEAGNALNLNPVYQQMRINYSEAQVEYASLRADLADREQDVDRLRKLVDVVPEVEARLNSLNRDYGVVKQRYETMLQQWENLQTTKRVRSGTEQLQFRIIDPPYASMTPVGPPRAVYILAAFIVALGAGVGLTILLTMINPVFSTLNELRARGLPVIGEIAMVDAEEGRRHEILPFAAAVGVLALAAIGATMLSEPGARIVQQLLS